MNQVSVQHTRRYVVLLKSMSRFSEMEKRTIVEVTISESARL